MDATNLLGSFKVVPVVVIENAELAVPLANAFLNGGIEVMEITLRTSQALQSIENIASRVPEMLTGAGSIRNVQHLADIQSAGARFAVSPGATRAMTAAATKSNLPYVPGVATPSEMIELFEQGYRLQKLFPAELVGGTRLLEAVAGPLPDVRFMPTGGISVRLAADYLALPNVSGVGGSWIAPPALIATQDFAQISALASEASRLGG